LLFVVLLRLAHDHGLVLHLSLIVCDLHCLGLVNHVDLLLQLEDLLFSWVELGLLRGSNRLLFLLIFLIVRLTLWLGVRLSKLLLLLRHHQVLLVLLILHSFMLLKLLILVLGTCHLAWHHHLSLLWLSSRLRILGLVLHLL